MINKNKKWMLSREAEEKEVAPGLRRKILVYCDELMTVVNIFEANATVDLHSHPNAQVAYILDGKFKFTIGDEEKIVEKGDSLLVQSDIKHSCVCLEKGSLIETFTPMREELL